MSDSNVVIANFINTKEIKTAPIFQYDYGMMLQFNNVSLPASYEVHFANYRFGASKVMIGDSTGVEIPYEYTKNYGRVFAWVFIHESEGVGWTKYLAEIPVIQRAKPSYDPVDPKEQSIVEQLASTVEGLQDDVEEVQDDVEEVQDDVEEVQEDVQTLQKKKADVIVSSASGAVATFSDGADDMPVESLKCYIEPVQDLNGYDNPWPAGGGKNKYDHATMGRVASGGTKTLSGFSFPPMAANQNHQIAVLDFSWNTDATAFSISFDVWASEDGAKCSFDGQPDELYTVGTSFSDQRITANTTKTRVSYSGTILNGTEQFRFFRTNSNVGATTATIYFENIQFEFSSSATSYSPYSNICPISGHTEVNVTRTGKNLLEVTAESVTTKGVTFTVNSDGSVLVDDTATETISFYLNSALQLPNGSFILSGCPSGGSNKNYSLQGSGGPPYDVGAGSSSFSEITGGGIRIRIASGVSCNNLLFKPMIRLASDADSAYEPYQGTTLTIDWTSEAGTVYGGTIDVATGLLTVDRAFAQLNDPDKWSSFVGTVDFRYDNRFTNRKMHSDSYTGLLCSYIGVVPGGGETARWIGEDGTFFGIKSSALTIDQVKSDAAAGKISICYPLATPTTYTITPQELTTLLGNNSIYCDTGNVEVSYPADTKLYIDGKIAELQALVLEN